MSVGAAEKEPKVSVHAVTAVSDEVDRQRRRTVAGPRGVCSGSTEVCTVVTEVAMVIHTPHELTLFQKHLPRQ